MRILHTSDWHLGARLGSQDRLPDQLQRLEEVVRQLDQKPPTPAPTEAKPAAEGSR